MTLKPPNPIDKLGELSPVGWAGEGGDQEALWALVVGRGPLPQLAAVGAPEAGGETPLCWLLLHTHAPPLRVTPTSFICRSFLRLSRPPPLASGQSRVPRLILGDPIPPQPRCLREQGPLRMATHRASVRRRAGSVAPAAGLPRSGSCLLWRGGGAAPVT